MSREEKLRRRRAIHLEDQMALCECSESVKKIEAAFKREHDRGYLEGLSSRDKVAREIRKIERVGR